MQYVLAIQFAHGFPSCIFDQEIDFNEKRFENIDMTVDFYDLWELLHERAFPEIFPDSSFFTLNHRWQLSYIIITIVIFKYINNLYKIGRRH